jgi:RNA polymerase sigma-70 factor (ECF subfamily)
MEHGGNERDMAALLYEQHAAAILKFATKKTGNIALAEDITSETFLRCLRFISEKGSCIIRPEAARAFLKRIAWNQIIDAWRRAGILEIVPLDSEHEDLLMAPGSDAIQIADERDRVCRAVHGLDDTVKYTIVLYYYAGMTTREIASAIGVKRGTIKTRLQRGRRQLAEQLQ